MSGGNPYKKIIKRAIKDIKSGASTLSRVRATGTLGRKTAEERAAIRAADSPGVRGYKGGNPRVDLYIKPKKAKVLGAGPIKGRGGGTIAYPENQDNVRRGKRPTIKYPEQQTIAVKRPKKPRGTIKYPAPMPAKAGHGGARGPKPPVKPRAESKYEG
mgnify:CR=1 FL=1